MLPMARQSRVKNPLDLRPAFQKPAISIAFALARSMRMASVFTPLSAKKQSNGPEIAPTEFCKNPNRSATAALSPTTAIPPIMSLWPLMYFVTL